VLKRSYLHLTATIMFATVNFLLYAKLWLEPGFISYGDTNYMFLPRSYNLRFENILNTYNNDVLAPRQGLWYSLLFTFFIHVLGGEIGHKVFLYIILLMSLFIIYYGFFKLFQSYFSLHRAWAMALIAAFFSFYNPYNGLTHSLGSTFGVSTIFVPYALYFLTAEKLERKDYLILFLLFMLCNAQPTPITYNMVLIPVAIIFHSLNKQVSKGVKRVVLYILLLTASSAYYLIPTIVIYYVLHYTATGIPYTKAAITYGQLKFLSPLNMLDLFLLTQHPRIFFQYHPDTRFPQNVLPLIMSLIPMFLIRKVEKNRSKLVNLMITFYMLLAVAIFLSKGVNPPLGELYYYLVKTLPDPAGAFLRNPAKFIMLYVYSLAVLISFSIAFVHEALEARIKVEAHGVGNRVGNIVILTIIVTVLLIPFNLFLIKLNYFTFANFGPHKIPEPYKELYGYFSGKMQSFARIAVFPVGNAYIWTRGNVFPTSHAILSAYPCTLLPLECYPLNKYLDRIQLLDFKYVVLHNDTYNVLTYKLVKEEYNKMLNTADKYSISKRAWCSYVNETYYRIAFKYRVAAPKPLDGFRLEISLASSGLRKEVWRHRVAELFEKELTKFMVKKNGLFITEGNVTFYVPRSMLGVYSKAYMKPVNLYIDPYSGGFRDIIPDPLFLGSYRDFHLVLNDRTRYLDASSKIEVDINLTEINIEHRSMKWCVALYELNTTPVYIYDNGTLKPLKSSKIIKGLGDVYRVKATIPVNVLDDLKTLTITLPFTFEKSRIWDINIYVNGNKVKDFKLLNIINVMGAEIPIANLTNTNLAKSPLTEDNISIEIVLVNKVFLFLIAGLTASLAVLTLLFLLTLQCGNTPCEA
jgi:hypothetical protein